MLIPKGERRNRILQMMASLVSMETYDREVVRVRAIDFRDKRCEHVPGDDIADEDIDGMLEWVWTKQHGMLPIEHGVVQSRDTTEAVTDTTNLLESLTGLFGKYMAFASEHEARALALWCLHTYVFAAFDQSPVLCIRSPERSCGKTRLVELTNCFARDSEVFINASPAFIYRLIEDTKPTFLLDEADAIFGEKSESSEVLRAIYNAGNRRDSYVGRCVGQGSNQKPKRFNVYTPKGLAAIGALPETIVSRSVVVLLQRKLAGEKLPRLRDRKRGALAAEWKPRLVLWATQAESELRGAQPEPPAGLEDRPADNWEALFAIAELAGGPWPAWAHDAALALQKDAVVEVSRKLDLLRDMREKLVPWINGETTVPLQLIVACLLEDEESPWRNMYGGKQLDAVAVGRLLKPYRLSVRTIRVAESHQKILDQARLAAAHPGQTIEPVKDRLRGVLAKDLNDVIDRYAVDE
jgi:hypothetical protein